jgi:hypothetical protein
MNVKSFEKTLFKTKETHRVLFLPVRVKNILKSRNEEKEELFYFNRFYFRPTTTSPLSDYEQDNNYRAVLDLKIQKEQFNDCKLINGIVAYNISPNQLEMLKLRELGYSIYTIDLQNIEFYDILSNKNFILDLVEFYPEKIKDINEYMWNKTLITKSATIKDTLNEINNLQLIDTQKIILKIFPKEIIVFASLPKDHYSIDLLEKVILFGKALFYPELKDAHQLVLKILEKGRSLLNQKIHFLEELKSQIYLLTTKDLDLIFNNPIIKGKDFINIINQFKNFDKIINKINVSESDLIQFILHLIIVKLLIEESNIVLKKTLSERFNLNFLPLQSYNEYIFKNTTKQWGLDFAEEFLDTTKLDDGTLLSKSELKCIEELIKISERYSYDVDLKKLSNPSIDWIFTSNLCSGVSPRSIAEKLFQLGCVKAITYINSNSKEVFFINKDIQQAERITTYRYLFQVIDCLRNMASPIIMKPNRFAFVYFDKSIISISSKNPKIKEIKVNTDILLTIFPNGIMSIIYRIQNFEDIITKIPLIYFLTIWTKNSEVDLIEISSLKNSDHSNNKNERFYKFHNKRELNEIKRFKSLTDLTSHFNERIRSLCKIKEFDPKYKAHFNHPILHLSMNSNGNEYDVLVNEYSETITKIITKYGTGQFYPISKIKNYSPYNDVYLFTDFNSLAIYEEKDYNLAGDRKMHLNMLMNYIMIIRQSIYVLDHELDELIQAKVDETRLYKLIKLQKSWYQYFNIIRPSRTLRNRKEVELANSIFEVFSLDNQLINIDERKEDLQEIFKTFNSNAEKWALNIVNILLASTLSFEFTSNIIFSFIAPNPWIYLIAWISFSVFFYFILKYIPKIYFLTKK